MKLKFFFLLVKSYVIGTTEHCTFMRVPNILFFRKSDKVRNGNREALTALRKIARTSQTSVPMLNSETIESGKDDAVTDCRTCGDYDRSEPLWFLSAGGDFFMNLPFHEAHLKLEMEQKQLDITVNKLHSKVKDQTLSLSEKGALADKIGPSILKSLVTLKDNS
ncbi:hypothetical protein L7F22_031967 [Adiantum nelumboides]|nr:hypothetical protein [Adiantum nelumboides]